MRTAIAAILWGIGWVCLMDALWEALHTEWQGVIALCLLWWCVNKEADIFGKD